MTDDDMLWEILDQQRDWTLDQRLADLAATMPARRLSPEAALDADDAIILVAWPKPELPPWGLNFFFCRGVLLLAQPDRDKVVVGFETEAEAVAFARRFQQ